MGLRLGDGGPEPEAGEVDLFGCSGWTVQMGHHGADSAKMVLVEPLD